MIPMLPERKRADFPLQSTLFHALYHSLQALSTDSKVKINHISPICPFFCFRKGLEEPPQA